MPSPSAVRRAHTGQRQVFGNQCLGTEYALFEFFLIYETWEAYLVPTQFPEQGPWGEERQCKLCSGKTGHLEGF